MAHLTPTAKFSQLYQVCHIRLLSLADSIQHKVGKAGKSALLSAEPQISFSAWHNQTAPSSVPQVGGWCVVGMHQPLSPLPLEDI